MGRVSIDNEIGFPEGNPDERELLLSWLGYLRGAVLRKIEGLSDENSKWTPNGALISLLGIVNHLTNVEWRWIDGGMRGLEVARHEEEFHPGPELTVVIRKVDAIACRALPVGRGHGPALGSPSPDPTRPLATPGMPTPHASCSTALRASDDRVVQPAKLGQRCSAR